MPTAARCTNFLIVLVYVVLCRKCKLWSRRCVNIFQVRPTLYNPPHTRVCYFYKDGDVNHAPLRINVNPRHYVTLDRLALDLQKKVRGLPNGVRSIYTPGGRDRITKINQLQNDGRYVVSTHRNKAQGVDIARVHNRRPWRGGRPPSVRKQYVNMLSESQIEQVEPTSSRTRRAFEPVNRKGLYNIQPPKKIEVIRNGDPSQKHVILLNRRTAQTFEQILEDLGQMFQMPAKKMFTLQGRAVSLLSCNVCACHQKALARYWHVQYFDFVHVVIWH